MTDRLKTTQNKQTETGSNTLLHLLNGLIKVYVEKIKEIKLKPEHHSDFENQVFIYTHPEYLIEIIKTMPEERIDENDETFYEASIEFIATSGELSQALNRYCKNQGIKNPYSSGSILASRLSNDRELLSKSGWEMPSPNPTLAPYYKKVHGNRFYKFIKKI